LIIDKKVDIIGEECTVVPAPVPAPPVKEELDPDWIQIA
jgi:hypothetical protein